MDFNIKQIIIFSLIALLIPGAVAFAYIFDISLKQQIDNDIAINEILCRNNSHVLVERINGKLACVYPTTAEKLNWELVYDEERRENLWLLNTPAVKDCVPKTPGQAVPDIGYENRTHYFEVKTCEWFNRN